MNQYRDVKKRILAAAMALLMIISAWQADVTALAASYIDPQESAQQDAQPQESTQSTAEDETAETPPEISFETDHVVVGVGAEAAYTLHPVVTSADESAVVYESSNDDIRVEDGRIVAEQAGTAVITASVGAASASLSVRALEASLDKTQIVYGERMPSVTVRWGDANDQKEALSFTEDSPVCAESEHFTALCEDAEKAGKATVTIRGKDESDREGYAYGDYETALELTILPQEERRSEAATEKPQMKSAAYAMERAADAEPYIGELFRVAFADGSTHQNCPYNRKVVKPAFELYRQGETMPIKANITDEDEIFELSVDGNMTTFYVAYEDDIELINVGRDDEPSKTITVTADGYTGSLLLTYRIVPRPINGSDITVSFVSTADRPVKYRDESARISPYMVQTREALMPKVQVKMGSRELAENTDYQVLYTNNIYIGTASVTVVGKGNFGNQTTKTFEIVGDFAKDVVLQLTDGANCYSDTGKYQLSPVSYRSDLTYDNRVSGLSMKGIKYSNGQYQLHSISRSDYEVTYSGDTQNVGEVTVTIAGKGIYAGADPLTATFQITPQDISKQEISVIGSWIYDGEPQVPEKEKVTLRNNVNAQLQDEDYKVVEFKNNINAGKATVTVEGIGNYTGTATGTFMIEPRDIAGLTTQTDDFSYSIDAMPYTGGQICPKEGNLHLYYKEKELVFGTDYSISGYGDNVSVGAGTVTVKGLGNFGKTVTLSFDINPKSMAELKYFLADGTTAAQTLVGTADGSLAAEFLVPGAVTTFDGTPRQPKLAVKNGNSALKERTDYEIIEYGNNINACEAKTDSRQKAYVTVEGVGNYAGKIKIYFAISPRDINQIAADRITVTGEENRNSAGVILPKVKIVDVINASDDVLDKGVEYQVTAKNPEDCKSAGAGKVAIISGMGNYTGQREVIYTIGKSLEPEKNELKVCLRGQNGSDASLGADGYYHISYQGRSKTGVSLLPEVIVRDAADESAVPLNKGTDYTVRFEPSTGDLYSADDEKIITVTIAAVPTSARCFGETQLKYKIDRAEITENLLVDTYAGGKDGTIYTHIYDGKAMPDGDYLKICYPGENDEELKAGKDGQAGTDYTLTCTQTSANAGTEFEVTIEGQGNFKGTFTRKYRVVTADIDTGKFNGADRFLVTVDDGNLLEYEYTGEEIRPKVTVYDKATGKYLVIGTDISIVYEGNKEVSANAGPAKIIISGQGNYTGIKNILFTIKGRDLNNRDNAKVSVFNRSETKFLYTGEKRELKPEDLQVTYKGELLTQATKNADGSYTGDYRCDYSHNVYPGEATVTIIGVNNYSGSQSATFKIYGNISDDTLFEEIRLDKKQDDQTPKYYVDSKGNMQSDSGAFNKNKIVGIRCQKNEVLLNNDGVHQDVTIRLEDFDKPGTGRLIITGNEDSSYYMGTRTVEIDVFGKLDEITISGLKDYYEYTGKPLEPSPEVVMFGNTPLVEGTDYNITYSNNTAAGRGVITFNPVVPTDPGKKNFYTGSKSFNFNIRYNLNKAKVYYEKPDGSTGEVAGDSLGAYSYQAAAIEPITKVCISKSGGEEQELIPGTDYVLSYLNNINAGTATLTFASVEGRSVGGWTKNKSFTIQPLELTRDNITVDGVKLSVSLPENDIPAKTYTGDAIIPAVQVNAAVGGLLTAGKDYRVDYANNRNVGTATVTVSSVVGGNYVIAAPGISKTFNIKPKDIEEDDVVIELADMEYDCGSPLKPQVALTYNVSTNNKKQLYENVNYTIEYGNNTEACTDADSGKKPGDAIGIKPYVKVEGTGNYTGSFIREFNITPIDLATSARCSLSTNSPCVYTGEPIEPEVVVTCRCNATGTNVRLTKDKDYSVEAPRMVDANVDGGSYQIKVSGSKNFINSRMLDYTVMPKSITAEGLEITEKGVDITGETVITRHVDWDDYNDQNRPLQLAIVDGSRTDSSGSKVELAEGTDYEIVYENIDRAASAAGANPPTVSIIGKGNYQGTKQYRFSIGDSLEDGELQITGEPYIYDGSPKLPEITVTLGDTTLSEGKHYIVREPADTSDITNAGTKPVIIEGIGNYYGEIKGSYEISPAVFEADSQELSSVLEMEREDGVYVTDYTGSEIRPAVTIRDHRIVDESGEARILTRGTEYDVTYENNFDAGSPESPQAIAVITFKGNYEGSEVRRIPFSIRTQELADARVRLDRDYYLYTGKAIDPQITVTDIGGRVLAPNKDYTVALWRNVSVGTASAVITGLGNYKGSVTRDFAIRGNLADAKITIEKQFYTGEPQKTPAVTVVCAGNTLREGTDYEVAFSSNDHYTKTGRVSITAIQNSFYVGSQIVDYTIDFDASSLKVSNYANEYTYTGKEICPKFVVTTPTGTVLSYRPEDVVYSNRSVGAARSYTENGSRAECTNAGTVTAAIPLTVGEHKTVVYAYYKILPRNINTCDIVHLQNNTYTGKAIKPPVVVKFDSRELKSGRDLTVTYSKNKTPGTADVVAKGTGNFTGTTTLHFNITSAAMVNLKASAASDSSVKLSWTKNVHVTGYQIYSADGKKKYGTTKGGSFTVKKLATAKNYSFRVRSYVVSDGKTSYGPFKSVSSYTKVSTPSITVKSSSKRKAQISWKKVSNVTGYEIYRSSSKNGQYKKIAAIPSKNLKYTDAKLTSGKKYYYKVRAYKKVSGKYIYGSYSAKKAVKVK